MNQVINKSGSYLEANQHGEFPGTTPKHPQRLSRDYANNEPEYKDIRQEPLSSRPFQPKETNRMSGKSTQ